MTAGTALVLHFPHAWVAARNNWEWLLEVVLGLQTLATAVLLIAVTLGGELRATGASLYEGIDWIRGLRHRPRRLADLRGILVLAGLVAVAGGLSAALQFTPLYQDYPSTAYLVPAALYLLAAIVWQRLFLRRRRGAMLDSPPRVAVPTIRQSIALLRLAALAGAATVSLGLCFDPRYRDFPVAAYLVPALFFVVADIARGGIWRAETDRREEAGFALLLVGMAVFIFCNETSLNLIADIWCGFSLLLAVPGLGAWRGLYQRLRMSSRAATRPTAASPAL
jgi:hypothetical protein